MVSAYPVDTLYSWRRGATCLVTKSGAMLLNPPRSEKLTDLSPEQRRALKVLNLAPATVADLGGESGLLERLRNGGWLSVAIRDRTHDAYALETFGRPPPVPTAEPAASYRLSKFAVLHHDSQGLVLENPLGWCDLRIHDPRLLPLLDPAGPNPPDVPAGLVARFRDDLRWGGFLETVETTSVTSDKTGFDAASWSAPDLWFHRRSTLGERVVTWDDFGPTRWAQGAYDPPAARRPEYPGTPLRLDIPDLSAIRLSDPPLAAVVEDRMSVRVFDDENPLTRGQLAELLYRSARTRSAQTGDDGVELLSRPYPSGGSVYELELYPVVRHVHGLPAGMYHYDSFEHVLRPVAEADSAAVSRLLKATSATLEGGAQPQVLLVMAARAGRVMWAYQQVAYANILKHVGVLMQTLYLNATAMGLGACAQGFGDTAAFTAAAAVPELQECHVGSMVLGSRRRD